MNWALVSIRGFARVSLIVAAVVGCASSVDDYAIARSQNSRAAYEGFIKRHPESAEARIARVQLEEIYAWETARSWNNLGSYKDFLSRFPNSQFAAQAESARDLLVETYEWKNVTKVDRAYVYERFVKRFPNGSHAVEAKSRRDVAQAQTQAKDDESVGYSSRGAGEHGAQAAEPHGAEA